MMYSIHISPGHFVRPHNLNPNRNQLGRAVEERIRITSKIRKSLLFLFVGFSSAFAQVPQNVTAKKINLPVYDGTNISALFSGSDAEPITGGKGELLVKDLEMKKFRDTTNHIEFIVKAAEAFALFNPAEKRVWSAKRLEVYDGRTNYFIEGEGFLSVLDKTNATLTISNRVHTLLKRESTNGQPIAPLEVNSDHFYFLSEIKTNAPKRVATYTRRVQVDDPELALSCEKLTMDLPIGTNRVRHIEAEQNVVILNKADKSRAYGERAIYINEGDGEFVRLMGKPVWRDAQSEGHAETFLFDRKNRMVLANKNARLKLPRGAMASGGLFNTKANVSTNEFVEIFSDHFGIQSATNRTRSLAARKNVVIVSEADQLRATAEQAFFDEATGRLQLVENATWKTDQFSASADTINLDRTNQIFKANGKARFKMLSKNVKSSLAATNQFVEIFSDSYEIRTNLAQFRGHVRGNFQQGNTPGDLLCQTLDVYLKDNEVEMLIAKGDVHFNQQVKKATNTVAKNITCELLTMKRSPATQLTSTIVAETNVVMLEIEKSSSAEKTRKLTGEIVTMRFSSTTNQLESLVAERNVEVSQGGNRAFGGKAIYRASLDGETFEVTEKPKAIRLSGTSIVEWEGIGTRDMIIVDLATGKLRTLGGKTSFRENPELKEKPLEKNVKSSLPKPE